MLVTGLALALPGCGGGEWGGIKPPKARNVVILAQGGASGYLPEHTLESYRRAIDMGADAIQVDVVATRDGVLIARRESYLSDSTNVATRSQFAPLHTRKSVDGVTQVGWFASDFTWAEIRMLSAVQAVPERDQSANGRYAIPTLEDVLNLAASESKRLNRNIGVRIELKQPSFHEEQRLRLEDRLLSILAQYNYRDAKSPVSVQSLEVASLKYLRKRTNVRLIQRLGANGLNDDGSLDYGRPHGKPYDFTLSGDGRTYASMLTPSGLKDIKTYADGISPWKPQLISARYVDRNKDGKLDDLNGDGIIDERDRVLMTPSSLLKDAKQAGLFVEPYAFRSEAKRLASDYKGSAQAEYRKFYDLGVNGVISDFPDHAKLAREKKK